MSNHEDDLEVQEPVDQQKEDESQKKGGTDNKHQLKDIDLSSIFVRNLDENTTEDDLKEYFKDCGTIVKVTLRSDKNTGTLYSYVQFQEQSSVEDALVLSEGIIRGKKILVFQKRTNLRNRGRGNRGARGQRTYKLLYNSILIYSYFQIIILKQLQLFIIQTVLQEEDICMQNQLEEEELIVVANEIFSQPPLYIITNKQKKYKKNNKKRYSFFSKNHKKIYFKNIHIKTRNQFYYSIDLDIFLVLT